MKGRPEDSFLAHFSERFMDHVRQVCTFAKLIPGFKCLHHDDQVCLLKSCVFEVLLVRLSGLFENQVKRKKNCDGVQSREKKISFARKCQRLNTATSFKFRVFENSSLAVRS